jgi:hypothetical protein
MIDTMLACFRILKRLVWEKNVSGRSKERMSMSSIIKTMSPVSLLLRTCANNPLMSREDIKFFISETPVHTSKEIQRHLV